MLQASRSGSRGHVGDGRHMNNSWRFWKQNGAVSRHCVYQSDSGSDASILSFSDARKRCGRHKKGGADGPLLKFVATSVLETQKAATLLQDVYVGAVSGATAGVVVEAALYPIDTIKTRLQVCIYVLQIVLI